MPYQTVTATRRQDLEAIEVNAPIGYIGNKIYPTLRRMQKAGKIYYQPLTSDDAAQTGRSALAAPTATALAPLNVDYTAAELIKRYGLDYAETEQYDGIENVDKVGAMASKRSVMRGIEDLQAAKLLSATRYAAASDIGSAIFDGLTAAADAVARYQGRLVLACSHYFFRELVKETEFKEILDFAVSSTPGNVSTMDVLSRNVNVLKNALQSVFLFDDILIGDDDHWKIATQEDCAAVVKVPEATDYGFKMAPELGRTVAYNDADGSMYHLGSHYDQTLEANLYTAKSWINVVEFQAGAAKLVKGIGTATT